MVYRAVWYQMWGTEDLPPLDVVSYRGEITPLSPRGQAVLGDIAETVRERGYPPEEVENTYPLPDWTCG
jgi:hypothetical protein